MSHRPMTHGILTAVFLFAATAAGQQAADPTAGRPLAAQWEYSTDGGKTFVAEAPAAAVKLAVTARAKFVIEDPAKIGAVKLMTASADGGFALTAADSFQPRYVAAKPVICKTNLVVNDKPTEGGCFVDRLHRYMTIEPELLKQGENRLTLSGVYGLAGEKISGGLKLESLPPDLAVLDHEPALGPIGPDFFSFTARAIIPCQYEVAVRPLDPPGEAKVHAMSDKTRHLRWKVALPAGTKKFSYALTVKAPAGAKTYGPYEVAVPTFGVGLRFVAAGNTAQYRHDMDRLRQFVRRMGEEKPQIIVLGGMLQNCPTQDFMWVAEFFPQCKDFLGRTPTYMSAGYKDLYSAAAYSEDFYFPTADGQFDHWTQVLGKVRLVAIEAFTMSQDGGRGLKWLEEVLRDAKEDYVLVFNCHVSHCSGGNAQFYFRPGIKYTTAHIDPLLVKYKVTATIGSYHYIYERSEPPASEGVPTIMTSRAGGFAWPLRSDMLAANKSSKVAVGKDHYCLFEVKPDRLVLEARDLDGKVFDTRDFLPRNRVQ